MQTHAQKEGGAEGANYATIIITVQCRHMRRKRVGLIAATYICWTRPSGRGWLEVGSVECPRLITCGVWYTNRHAMHLVSTTFVNVLSCMFVDHDVAIDFTTSDTIVNQSLSYVLI